MQQKKKVYTTAPLPFMGQKRRFINDFKEALKLYPDDATYVDLFGGSGLLSHTIKAVYPDATVIYNDFDGYSERIENIPKTNALIQDLRLILEDWPKDKRITGEIRDKVIKRVGQEKGFVDYITLSSSILFSMNYVLSFTELERNTLFNCIRKNPYNADGYLDNLTIVTADYKELFNTYKSMDNVIFVVDPPYLATESGTYKNYWKLSDYLDVLDVLNGTAYFYFTSNKSSIVELCEWVETKTGGQNPFAGAYKKEIQMQMNYASSYTDIMLHKNWIETIS